MEAVVTLIAGGIVTWSLVVRYQTINSPEFIENTRVTVGVFFAFAIGFIMLYPKTGDSLPIDITKHWISLFIFGSPLFIFPIFQILKGNSISYAFYPFNLQTAQRIFFWCLAWFIPIGVIVILAGTFFQSLDYQAQSSLQDAFFWVLPRLFFVSFAIFLGFIHSLLGTVIAGINIAMILAHFFLEGSFGASLGSVFDFFEMIGISSVAMKWAIMFISTFLGVHSAMSLQDMKDLIQNGLI